MAATVGAAITNHTLPRRHSNIGPFKSSAGNFYVVTRGQAAFTNLIVPFKITDPIAGTWAALTSIGTLNGGECTVLSVYQVGNVLHVAFVETGLVQYRQFDMATDAWLGTIETIADPPGSPSIDYTFASLIVRSNGEAVCTFAESVSVSMVTYQRVSFKRRVGGVWETSGTPLDAAGSVNYSNPVAVLGASDRVHFFFTDNTNRPLQSRTLSQANALSSVVTVDPESSSVAQGPHPMVVGSTYVDGAITRLVIPFSHFNSASVTTQGYVATGDSLDSPTFSITAVQDSSTANVKRTNGQSIMFPGIDGTTRHVLFGDSATADLMRDVNTGTGWGTDVNELVGTINQVSANIYDRTGSKLAMLLDDGGVIKYAEIGLAPADTTPPAAPTALTATVIGE